MATREEWAEHLTLRHSRQFEVETPTKDGILLSQVETDSLRKMHSVLHEKIKQDHSLGEV